MSGRRQHVIPKLLLKGFASRRVGNQSYVWVFRRGAQPFETNIVNTGVEAAFYGEPGVGSTDEVITDFEEENVALVDYLRLQSGSRTLTEVLPIARYVAHLAIRTKNLRSSCIESATYITERIRERLDTNNAVRKMLANHLRKEPGAILAELERGPVLTSKERKQVLKKLSKQYKMLRAVSSSIQDIFKQHVEALILKIAPEVKKAHNRSIHQQPAPALRVEELCRMHWRLNVNATTPLVLGDIAVIFQLKATGGFKALSEKDDAVVRVFLPLSPTHLLIGENDDLPPVPTPSEFNREMVRCSYEQFVSAIREPTQTTLQQEIGRVPMFPVKMLDEIVDSVLQEHFR